MTEFYWKYSLQFWTKHNRKWKRLDPFPPLHSSCWKWPTPSLSKGYMCFLEYGYASSRFSHFAEATWSNTTFYQLHEKVTFHFYFHLGLYTLPFLKDPFFQSHSDLEFGIKLLLRKYHCCNFLLHFYFVLCLYGHGWNDNKAPWLDLMWINIGLSWFFPQWKEERFLGLTWYARWFHTDLPSD